MISWFLQGGRNVISNEKVLVLFAEIITLKDDLKSAIKEARQLRSHNEDLNITDLIDDFRTIEKKAMQLKSEALKSHFSSLLMLFCGFACIGLCFGFYGAYIKSEEIFLRDLRHSQVADLEKEYFNLRNIAGENLLLINYLRDQGVVISTDYILVPNRITDGTGFVKNGSMSAIWIN